MQVHELLRIAAFPSEYLHVHIIGHTQACLLPFLVSDDFVALLPWCHGY